MRDGARDLDGWEVGGALAAQIQALIDERYRQHRRVATPAAEQPTVATMATRLARPASTSEQPS